MIEVSCLTKTYGKKRGIDRISFSVADGEIVGFLGPNGAGKSTAMNIITGYLSPNSGSVKVGGKDVLDDPVAAKRMMGYLPEQPPLYPDMTVDEYLDFIYDLKGVSGRRRSEHIAEVCRLAGLSEQRKRVIGNLSKGYKQRTGLAQALIGDPEVLILDEPTVGLDPRQIIEIRNVIKTLGKNRTVILSTHILQEVSAICERVLVINNGRIVADGKPDELSSVITGDRKLTVRVAGPRDAVRRLLRSVDGVLYADVTVQSEKGAYDFLVESRPNVDVRKPMFAALAKAGYPILQLKTVELSLEEIFMRLVEEKRRADAGDALPDRRPGEGLFTGLGSDEEDEKEEDGV
ncbi:MAG: ABC transporter ATP-binding protein [Oscillospiraceae bacterium]|jgi:ABC-2 type transport system ATP-binding protein|nr:ABC transporter ATP-binding protein [Oscillospiraceae bacterium]